MGVMGCSVGVKRVLCGCDGVLYEWDEVIVLVCWGVVRV